MTEEKCDSLAREALRIATKDKDNRHFLVRATGFSMAIAVVIVAAFLGYALSQYVSSYLDQKFSHHEAN